MSVILAIECATGPCSTAVWAGGRVAAYLEHLPPVAQSARLLPMIEQALKEAGLGYGDLTAVACTVGPGSFTSIRVGLATARGICFSTGLPGLGFTTLDVLACGAQKHFAKDAVSVLAMLNAGKGEYYYRHYDETGNPSSPPSLGTIEAALLSARAPFVTAGNAPGACPIHFLRADILAEMAATRPATLPLRPFYIRPPDAKPQAKKA